MSENLLDCEQIYAHCIENTCTAMPQVMETDLFQTMLSHKIMKSLSKRIGWHTFTVRIADKISVVCMIVAIPKDNFIFRVLINEFLD